MPAEKIVFTGDLITENAYPLIHMEKNGSSDGWIQSVKGMIALNADASIPGIASFKPKPISRKISPTQKLGGPMIKRMVAEGKSLQDIKDALDEKPQLPAAPASTHLSRPSPKLRIRNSQQRRRHN